LKIQLPYDHEHDDPHNITYLHLLFNTMSSENPYFWKNSTAALSAWTTTASYWPTIAGSIICWN